MKLWIYENHICEQWSEELFEGRSSQLHTQLMQAFFLQLFIIPIQYWKERMKKTRSTDLTSPPNNRRSPELRQDLESLPAWSYQFFEDPARGGGESHVAHLNFKTSHVGVHKCLSLIVGFAVTDAIWQRGVVSCRDFILRALATFWAMSLVRIYPGRASWLVQAGSEPTSSSSIDRGSPN